MEVLDLEINDKNKKVFVYLIEKENKKFNLKEIENLKHFLNEKDIIFGTIDQDLVKILPFSLLKPMEGNLPILHEVGIPIFVKSHLEEEIEKKREILDDLEKEMDETDLFSLKGQNLESWIEYIEGEIIQMESNLNFDLRNNWVAQKIIDLVNNFYIKNQKIIHFTPRKYIPGLKKIFEDLHIPTKTISLKQTKYKLFSIQSIK